MARFGEHGDQLGKNGKGIDYSNIQGNIQQYGVWPCPREPKAWPVGFFKGVTDRRQALFQRTVGRLLGGKRY